MSLVTRCPACDTTFKVVRDQLRISDGWVRCGRCSHVFDASVDLREIDDAPVTPGELNAQAEAPQPVASEVDAFASVADVPAELSEEPLDDRVVVSEKVDEDALRVEPAAFLTGLVADEPWPEPDAIGNASSNSNPVPLTRYRSVAEMAPSLELDAIGQAQLQKALRRARVKSVQAARARNPEAQSEIDPAEPTKPAPLVQTASENEAAVVSAAGSSPFLLASSNPDFWRRSTVRAVLGVAILVALVVLAGQVLQRERDAIAARQPSLRPVLAKICAVTGCNLSALRQIADITIDGAAFARDKAGDGYRLSFTLRNAATVPLAMPAVELSLLDSQEQVVIRRVLMPAEFNAPDELPARAERAASLPLTLTGAEAAALPPIAGYRVVAFYP